MLIRPCRTDDAASIAEIYNDAVANTLAIWNERLSDEADRRAWIEDKIRSGYPLLVAVDDDDAVMGYATFGDWRPWQGYRFSVEHSVYVRADCRRLGVGRALMAELIARARGLGKHAMVAGIEADNAASIALHRELGFVESGVLSEVGTKFGRWLDLAFLTLRLDDEAPVAPSRPAG